MKTITVIPAYGRDYKSKKAILEDWNASKDFQIATFGPDDGHYINKEDLAKDTTGLTHLNFRHKQLTQLCVFTVRQLTQVTEKA